VSSRAPDSHWRHSVATFLGIVMVLLSAYLFIGAPPEPPNKPLPMAAEAVTPPLRSVPIEQVRLAQRVAGANPVPDEAEEVEPDAATWREFHFYMTKEDGLGLWIGLLRPAEWIELYDIHVGNTVYIDLYEMGIEGDAEVIYVGPCPAIEPGEGTVVTGTFKHEASPDTQVLNLHLEGQTDPTGVTDNHPYWSVDREEFVAAGDLRPGERVDTEFGPRRIVSILPIRHVDFLYNIETTEHVYRVGESGALVHNVCGIFRKFDGPIHHIATDKHSVFTPRFKELFDRAGLSLQSAWNRIRVPGHVGPHGDFYNRLVLQRLETAVGAKSGSAAKSALIQELKSIRRDIRHNGWDALLKAAASKADRLGNF
jgi:hypothetical protein